MRILPGNDLEYVKDDTSVKRRANGRGATLAPARQFPAENIRNNPCLADKSERL